MANLLQKLGLAAAIGLPVLSAAAAVGYEKRMEGEIVPGGMQGFGGTYVPYGSDTCDRTRSLFEVQKDYFHVSSIWGVPVHSAFQYSTREVFYCAGRKPLVGRITYADGTSHLLTLTRPGDPL